MNFSCKLKIRHKEYATYEMISEDVEEPRKVNVHIGQGVSHDNQGSIGVMIGDRIDVEHRSSNVFFLRDGSWFMVTNSKDIKCEGDDHEALQALYTSYINDLMLEEPETNNVRAIK